MVLLKLRLLLGKFQRHLLDTSSLPLRFPPTSPPSHFASLPLRLPPQLVDQVLVRVECEVAMIIEVARTGKLS